MYIEDGESTLTLGYNSYNGNDTGKGLFYDCPLETLYLGRNLSYYTGYKYGYSPFYNKSTLTSVTIGNSVTSIGEDAFYKCSGLKEVHIDDLSAWCNISFGNGYANPLYYAKKMYLKGKLVKEVVIPDNISKIKNHLFYGCTSITSVLIPNSVTEIKKSAFCYCSGLTSVTIGNSVTSIGRYAFEYCSGLTSVRIPNSVTSIGDYAFNYCTSLKELYIEDGESTLTLGYNSYNSNGTGKGLFYDCPLETLYLGRGMSYEAGYNYGYSPFYGKSTLTSVTIGNSVTSIEYYAFEGCSGLKKVELNCQTIGSWFCGKSSIEEIVLGDNVTSIRYNAFYNCSGLTSVEIPNSVTFIGWGAFEGCSGLTSVTIGSGVKNIDYVAFAKCENLTDVYCLATTVPSTKSDAFNESYPEYMTLHVPAEAINSYKTTEPWSSFGTIVTLDGDEDNTTNIISVPAVAVLVTSANGAVTVSCSLEGESVAAYTTDGTAIGTAVIVNGSATIQSGLSKGSIAIVKIGNKSVKVVVD